VFQSCLIVGPIEVALETRKHFKEQGVALPKTGLRFSKKGSTRMCVCVCLLVCFSVKALYRLVKMALDGSQELQMASGSSRWFLMAPDGSRWIWMASKT
jgi:hypothetical protein